MSTHVGHLGDDRWGATMSLSGSIQALEEVRAAWKSRALKAERKLARIRDMFRVRQSDGQIVFTGDSLLTLLAVIDEGT